MPGTKRRPFSFTVLVVLAIASIPALGHHTFAGEAIGLKLNELLARPQP